MGHYIRRRVLTAIPVFFGITLLVFFLFDLAPGSIADLMGEGAAASGDRAALEAALGLDRPPLLRYLQWLGGLLRGDLGESFFYGRPVAQLLAQRVGPSLLLTGTGVVLAVALALPLGILAAWKPRSAWDRLADALSLISFGVPGFFSLWQASPSLLWPWGGSPPGACTSTGPSPPCRTCCGTWCCRREWCASAAWASW